MPTIRSLTLLFLLAASAGSHAEPRLIEPSVFRADVDTMIAALEASHWDLYERRPRADYAAHVRQVVDAVDGPMTTADAQIALQRILAYGNVAHANTDLPAAGWERHLLDGGGRFPLRLRVREGRAYVLENLSGDPRLAAGTEIVSVDGQQVLDWLAAPRALLSADTDYFAYALLEDSLAELLWYVRGPQPTHAIGVAGLDEPVAADAVTAKQVEQVRAGRSVPTWARWSERRFDVLDGGIAYLRPGPFYDNRPDAPHMWDPAAFTQFIDDSFRALAESGAKDLIVDLRHNPGGDNSFSDRLIERIADRPSKFARRFEIRVSAATIASAKQRADAAPDNAGAVLLAKRLQDQKPGTVLDFPLDEVVPRDDRYRGRVHVIVDRHSYSNTVFVAATIQDYRFGRVYGEETADLATTFGAMEALTLPNTGLVVRYPKARIVRPSGDTTLRGVVPDEVIDMPLEDGAVDAVLLEVVRRVQASR